MDHREFKAPPPMPAPTDRESLAACIRENDEVIETARANIADLMAICPDYITKLRNQLTERGNTLAEEFIAAKDWETQQNLMSQHLIAQSASLLIGKLMLEEIKKRNGW